MEEREVKLIDYFNIIWKRKWLIIIPTFFCVIIAGIVSFLLPQEWEIDVLVMPSKFLIETQQGRFEEVLVVDPKQITGQINQESYNSLIAAELNLDLKDFPELKAENLTGTELVRISAREKDIDKAKSILRSLFVLLKRELDGKVEIEMKGIDSQIKSNEIEKTRINEEIKAFKRKLNIVKQRIKEINEEIRETRKRVELLEKEQRGSLKKENRSESESLAMLLYSNEIQQSLRYYNTLNELLSSKKIEENNINVDIENKEERIMQLENEIDNLNERKGRIDYTQLIKEPTVSIFPVFPKKTQNVLIAGILALMIFSMLVFFIEYIEKQKVKR